VGNIKKQLGQVYSPMNIPNFVYGGEDAVAEEKVKTRKGPDNNLDEDGMYHEPFYDGDHTRAVGVMQPNQMQAQQNALSALSGQQLTPQMRTGRKEQNADGSQSK